MDLIDKSMDYDLKTHCKHCGISSTQNLSFSIRWNCQHEWKCDHVRCLTCSSGKMNVKIFSQFHIILIFIEHFIINIATFFQNVGMAQNPSDFMANKRFPHNDQNILRAFNSFWGLKWHIYVGQS